MNMRPETEWGLAALFFFIPTSNTALAAFMPARPMIPCHRPQNNGHVKAMATNHSPSVFLIPYLRILVRHTPFCLCDNWKPRVFPSRATVTVRAVHARRSSRKDAQIAAPHVRSISPTMTFTGYMRFTSFQFWDPNRGPLIGAPG
jgi:hypothetical protein